MKISIVKKALFSLAAAVLVVSTGAGSVLAANTADITQTINSGTLTTDIRDASRVTVGSPTFAMSASTFSFACQTSTGTVGSNTQRLYLDNPNGASNGWTVTVAATAGATGLWNNTGSTRNFDFNDATGSGCTDGADADTKGGQMTLNPAAGTLTTDCASCVTTNITKGSSTPFVQATTDSITLLNAAAASDDIGRWYFTGIGVSQSIPAEQIPDSYTINLTVTATAS